jgi:hypothetical protein
MDNINGEKVKKVKSERVLLLLLPFWAPLTPPLGISCLKGAIKKHCYYVKTNDANQNPLLWGVQKTYLETLTNYIPKEKRGNISMVGYDIFMNHLMAYLNQKIHSEYFGLVRILIAKNFFVEITDDKIQKLCEIIESFYCILEEYLLGIMESEKPTIVGISVYSITLAASLFAFKFIKRKYPYIKTVMGGGIFADQLAYNSPNLELFVKQTPYIDKILIGEGEVLFIKLLKGELSAPQKVHTLEDINYELLDLEKTEIPDFSDFNLSMYPQMATYASRSCPFQCSFCSETVQWGKYRKKDPKQVADELISLYKIFGRQLFLLGDSLLNPIVTELATELISRDTVIYWDAYLRADKPVCIPENAFLWRRGGLYRARLGIESGSQKVLNLMNKNITVDQIKGALSSLANAGIKTTTYWVLGHPNETEEDFRETLSLVEELQDYIYEADWHPFYFFPSGQVNSSKWIEENGMSLLYPEDTSNLLLTQTWVLNCKPSREEVYDRVCRFAECCERNGIRNLYSLSDIHKADERWRKLHKYAVPSLMNLHNNSIYFDECRNVKELMKTKSIDNTGDFNF